MTNKRSALFKKIFKPKKDNPINTQTLESNNQYASFFTIDDMKKKSPDESNMAIKSVFTISKHIATTKLIHERRNIKGEIELVNDNTTKLLTLSPNSLMTAYSFWQKVITKCLLNDCPFVWIKRDNLTGEPIELLPIDDCKSQEIVKIKEFNNEPTIKFTMNDGTQQLIPYSDVLYFRNFMYNKTFFAQELVDVGKVVSINECLWDSLVVWSQNSSVVRGILQSQSVLKDEDIATAEDKIASKLFNSKKSSVPVLDAKFEYVPLNNNSVGINVDYVKLIGDELMSNYGINEKIINNTYDSTEWQSYLKGCLEPLYTLIEQELATKLITTRELGFSHRFRFIVDDFEHASITEKTSALTLLSNIGAVSINEIRCAYGLDKITDEVGDKLMYSKNFAELGNTDETSGSAKGKENDDGEI